MKQATRVAIRPSNIAFKELEAMAKGHIQDWLQQLLEAEVTDFLGRMKSERKGPVDASAGYRNGFGKPRRLATSFGTLTVKRPRVRDTEDPFESKLLPLFVRRTEELGAMLPELYLHGLARGDFEPALRGLHRRRRSALGEQHRPTQGGLGQRVHAAGASATCPSWRSFTSGRTAST